MSIKALHREIASLQGEVEAHPHSLARVQGAGLGPLVLPLDSLYPPAAPAPSRQPSPEVHLLAVHVSDG